MPAVNVPKQVRDRTRRSRPQRADVRRRVLAAALEVFVAHGFARSTLDDVAAAAGFTKGAVYSNFASKDELFYALMDDQVHARIERVQGLVARASGDDLASALRLAGIALAEASVEERNWQVLFVEFWLRAMHDDDVRRAFVAHRRTLRTAIAHELAEAYPDIESATGLSVDDLTTLLLALSNGFAIESLIDGRAAPPRLFADTLARLASPVTVARPRRTARR